MSTFVQIRAALAAQIAAQVPGLRSVTTRLGQINPPCAIVLPGDGTFASYQVSMDGQADYQFRVVLVVSAADSESGQDELDAYIETAAVWHAVREDTTLGGVVGFAGVTEAAGYGQLSVAGVDYLAASWTVEIGD